MRKVVHRIAIIIVSTYVPPWGCLLGLINPLPALLMIPIGGAVIALVTVFAVAIGVTRIALVTGLLLLWTALFGPAKTLNAIAKRTGTESFFSVGKYVIVVVLWILSLLQ